MMIRIVCDECDREDTATVTRGGPLTPEKFQLQLPYGWTTRDRYAPPVDVREEHLCPRCVRRSRERAR